MCLSRQKALLLAAAFTMACHESTGPPQTVSGLYVLRSVNGRPVPAFLNAGLSDTTFILWATLRLDSAGNAFRAERWRYVYQPNRTDEGTFTIQSEYRIIGKNITVGSFKLCAPNELCEGNKVGKLTNTTLTLAYESPNAPVYLYRRAQTY
ncbi:MAG: hypothetical protein H7Z74_08185 [Anaerolineae bacterium]|nr:hypothetical protein [Gemmatimonadaceae bacterium]